MTDRTKFALDTNFGDVEALFNLRSWLETALVNHGATVTGGGMGCRAADLDIKLDGFNFVVSITPMP